MKEIQEKRIENEISLTQHSIIPSKFKKINKEEYHIEVSVPYNLIENESVKTDIVFLIHMVPNFPFSQPKVYCKTPVTIIIII